MDANNVYFAENIYKYLSVNMKYCLLDYILTSLISTIFAIRYYTQLNNVGLLPSILEELVFDMAAYLSFYFCLRAFWTFNRI